ncbi:hypothetical protein JW916_03805 [Candidatus Sumerlaeota bacterium]|nr:hypothetical protein [Candidatus Sumerlaeota bacterium]
MVLGARANRWMGCAVLLVGVLAMGGCSRAIRLRTPIEKVHHPSGIRGGPYGISVSPVEPASCVHQNLVAYLKKSPRWSLESTPRPETELYELRWTLVEDSFQSDLPTKRSVVIYLYCTIIDAFLAPFFANMLPWHATQYVEIDLKLVDGHGQELYHYRKGLAVNEHDKTLPSTVELKKAMHALAVGNLAIQMMNRLEKTVLPQLSEAPGRPE